MQSPRKIPLYEAISAGMRYAGMEHWLPLFHDRLETIFDYLADGTEITLDYNSDKAFEARFEQIEEHYSSRDRALEKEAFGTAPYNPVKAKTLYLDEFELARQLAGQLANQMSDCKRASLRVRSSSNPPVVGSIK